MIHPRRLFSSDSEKENYSAPFETKVVVLGKKLSESQAIKK